MNTVTTTKKAYLVEFVITTRVVCDEQEIPGTEGEEFVMIAALDKLRKEPAEYLIGDNCTDITEDTECPYDPATDKEPALDPIDWTRKDNDVNGNPRYVCHFLTFITDKDTFTSLDQRYALALARAKKLGGRKYHNKQYGGGIIFQSYNTKDLENKIVELMQQYK